QRILPRSAAVGAVQDEQRVTAQLFVRERTCQQGQDLWVGGVEVHLFRLADGPRPARQQQPLHGIGNGAEQVGQVGRIRYGLNGCGRHVVILPEGGGPVSSASKGRCSRPFPAPDPSKNGEDPGTGTQLDWRCFPIELRPRSWTPRSWTKEIIVTVRSKHKVTQFTFDG